MRDQKAWSWYFGKRQCLKQQIEAFDTSILDSAAKSGNLDLVRFLHENRTEGCTTDAIDGAAACGRLDIVRFLHENRTEGCTPRAMDNAATFGDLDIVRFLHENRTEDVLLMLCMVQQCVVIWML